MTATNNIHTIVRAFIKTQDYILIAYNGINYFLLGGHMKSSESAQLALARELREEIGIHDAEIGQFAGIVEHSWNLNGSPFHEISLIFQVSSNQLFNTKEVQSREPHLEFHWIKFDALKNINFLPIGMDDFLINYATQKSAIFWSTL